MAEKTIHVYRSDGAWAVKKAGTSARTFPTQKEAIDAAKDTARKQNAAQYVVHGENGEILDYGAYGIVRSKTPRKRAGSQAGLGGSSAKPHLRKSGRTTKSQVDVRLKSNHVFVNCPFDPGYGSMFDAIVFGVCHLGFVARCAREDDDAGEVRLSKIERILGVPVRKQ